MKSKFFITAWVLFWLFFLHRVFGDDINTYSYGANITYDAEVMPDVLKAGVRAGYLDAWAVITQEDANVQYTSDTASNAYADAFNKDATDQVSVAEDMATGVLSVVGGTSSGMVKTLSKSVELSGGLFASFYGPSTSGSGLSGPPGSGGSGGSGTMGTMGIGGADVVVAKSPALIVPVNSKEGILLDVGGMLAEGADGVQEFGRSLIGSTFTVAHPAAGALALHVPAHDSVFWTVASFIYSLFYVAGTVAVGINIARLIGGAGKVEWEQLTFPWG